MKLEIRKIFIILLISSVVGIIFNFINPSGISLIREDKTLSFVSDSSLIPELNQNVKENTDTTKVLIDSIKIKENNNSKTEIKNTIKQEESKSEITQEELVNDGEQKEEETIAEPKAINLEQAFTLFNNGAKFIDARDVLDYKEGHISNSINVPFYAFEENEHKLININKDETIVTYCNGTDCDLSVMLGNKLAEMGYRKVLIFFGGWWDWVEANYPTTLSQQNQE